MAARASHAMRHTVTQLQQLTLRSLPVRSVHRVLGAALANERGELMGTAMARIARTRVPRATRTTWQLVRLACDAAAAGVPDVSTLLRGDARVSRSTVLPSVRRQATAWTLVAQAALETRTLIAETIGVPPDGVLAWTERRGTPTRAITLPLLVPLAVRNDGLAGRARIGRARNGGSRSPD